MRFLEINALMELTTKMVIVSLRFHAEMAMSGIKIIFGVSVHQDSSVLVIHVLNAQMEKVGLMDKDVFVLKDLLIKDLLVNRLLLINAKIFPIRFGRILSVNVVLDSRRWDFNVFAMEHK